MTFAGRYLREHLSVICIEILFVCIFAVVFSLYHLPLAAVLYPAFLCFLAGAVFFCFRMHRAYVGHKRLVLLQSLKGTKVWEVLEKDFPGKGNIQEKDYRRIIENLCGELRGREEETAAAYREMKDYFTVWVHQIKTPIASIRLSLSGEDTLLSRKMASDILHMEQYVDMVLTYFKMGGHSSDYVFSDVNLDEVIRENIRKLRGDFIMKKLALIYEPIKETVVSDEKWLSFVIEQVLSNALKYTQEGSVTIFLEKPGILCIRDTGIGIAPQELPRIFEKGFTGEKGREDKRATGIGLYLCRQICDKIGAKIWAESREESGTTVKIDLRGGKEIVTKL
ncbi:MAG: sensor histidine kinase [Lachnospiraceae bacterium]|nr:sensor histidine kinase [Lachnospiraceae bacterium]